MKNKNLVKNIILVIAILLVAICISMVSYSVISKIVVGNLYPIATIEIENYGTIKVELYPDKAPNTVTNFVALANRGFYDGLTFHRVVEGFMIQGGDKEGDGTGSPTLGDLKGTDDTTKYNIKGEMIANGYSKNNIKLQRGVIAMGRTDYTSISSSLTTESYNSAGSQFFILQEDTKSIDGRYAGFGKVIEGMDIVDKIASLEVTYKSDDLKDDEEAPKDEEGNTIKADMPKEKPVIKSIRVETYGEDYGEPETVEPFNYYNYLMEQYNNSLNTDSDTEAETEAE